MSFLEGGAGLLMLGDRPVNDPEDMPAREIAESFHETSLGQGHGGVVLSLLVEDEGLDGEGLTVIRFVLEDLIAISYSFVVLLVFVEFLLCEGGGRTTAEERSSRYCCGSVESRFIFIL